MKINLVLGPNQPTPTKKGNEMSITSWYSTYLANLRKTYKLIFTDK